MLICSNCKKEMKCIKTGSKVRYGNDNSHTYPCDIFECTECHNITATCETNPYHDTSEIEPDEIIMS